jgi:hypothetical protein
MRRMSISMFAIVVVVASERLGGRTSSEGLEMGKSSFGGWRWLGRGRTNV